MKYRELCGWILNTMRMSEIYQPAAIVCLMFRGGVATLEQIHDEIELRRQEREPAIHPRTLSETKKMPCEVLCENGVIQDSQRGYVLLDYENYTPQQRTAIIAICEDRIADWNRTRSAKE